MDAKKFNRLMKTIKYDSKAFSEIYEEYYPKIKIHVQRRFGRLVCAEDISQEVFLKLLSLDVKEYVEYPTAWVYALADNKVKDILRATHDEIALSDLCTASFDLDDTILSVDIKSALLHLDEMSQQILYLHIWEGYSYKEIALELNLGYANVRVKASRALKTLKKHL